MNPSLSIIVTTHNRPNLLARALKSIYSQEFDDFEIILCADEGLKETKEVAFKHLRPADSFICAPRIDGPAGTRNLGISIASGRHICFLDDDDSFPATYLLEATNYLSDSYEIHFCNYYKVLEGQENMEVDIGEISIERLMVCNFIPNNALFVPTTIAQKYPFDVRLQSHEDWDWLLMLHTHGYVFKHHSFFGPNVHIGQNSSRNNNAKKSKSIGLDFLSIYRKWPAQSEDLKIARSEMLKAFEMGAPIRFL
jgi:glycosyltransferase involved in cell wall biosynthesis